MVDALRNLLAVYLVPSLLIFLGYILYRREIDRKNKALQKEECDAGLTEPPSLHPVIDPAKCLGCAACVEACPEKDVLGLINGRAQLITPTQCIGHGACREACPLDAITLVFGTEKRGVDIPLVRPNFETNIGGIFIAGELGGMGLIRNAVEQGRQAIEAVEKKVKGEEKQAGVHDVIIVGAGPAGFAASLAALERKMDYLTFEQETFGGTVAHYPRGKIVMTHPAMLPIIGKTKFRETTKEDLIEFWQKAKVRTGVQIHCGECVDKITRENGSIVVTTPKGTYKARAVLLAIGRRGTPRKLGVPGEEKSKVVYRLIDAQQYKSRHVLVVGGGDSALETAIAVAEVEGTTVTLSYRGEAFSRVKSKNRDRVQNAEGKGNLKVLLKSNVKEVKDKEVILDQEGREFTLPNDAVIICAGGILPTPFLKEIGIEIETKHGTV